MRKEGVMYMAGENSQSPGPSETRAGEFLSGGQAVVRVLEKEQVRAVFCVPGESYLGVLDALYEHPTIRLISNRHENGASFMAEAFAKATGEVGVCMATRAVGAANLSIGLHTAMQDSTPVVALLGQVERGFRGREAFQELDLVAMFAHVCKWTVEIDAAARIPELLHRAFHVARNGRPGPVLVALPHDMLEETVEAIIADTVKGEAAADGTSPVEAVSTNAPSAPGVTTQLVFGPIRTPLIQPGVEEVKAAVAMMERAERPVLVVGGGVRTAAAVKALVGFAEAFQLPVVTAFRRFDVFPNSHPCYAGWLGFGPAEYVLQAIREADLVIGIGTRFSQVTTQDYTLLHPHQALLHVDLAAETFAKVYPPGLAIQSDAQQFMLAALSVLTPQARAKRTGYIADLHTKFLGFSDTSSAVDHPDGSYVDLKRMVHDVQALLPATALITSDAGNFFGWLVKYFRFDHFPSYFGPTSGAMGYGLPAAVGVKLAHPDRTVVCFSGDGGFMMTLQELETAVRFKVPLVVVVINNNLYGTIRAHQERHFPNRVIGTQLGNPNYAQLAETFGAWGEQVHTNSDFREAFKRALEVSVRAGVPALIEVLSNPEILSVRAQP